MPIPDKEENMEGEGWTKELTIKRIEFKRGTVWCEEWDFFVDKMPCRIKEGGTSGPDCGIDHVWIRCFNGKLFWCCFRHRIANGPISFEIGRKAKEYVVNASDAIKICQGTGQAITRELMEMQTASSADKFGTKRRPKQK